MNGKLDVAPAVIINVFTTCLHYNILEDSIIVTAVLN